ASALWEIYTTSMLAATHALRRVFVSYERFIAAPHDACRELFDALAAHGVRGLAMPGANEIDAFIDPGLQRSTNRRKIALPARLLDLDEAVRNGRVEARHLRADDAAFVALREFHAQLEEERSYHFLLGVAVPSSGEIERTIAQRLAQQPEPQAAWTIERLRRLARRD
ncbi:MAG TPA: hypothetical protein VM915_16425, partial [Verrucomicrobiae bacterium]|nr:hypothetical protein [Verrucomicrobiae bacterium]